MDAYADLLEQLRRDDCRRLRAYTADQRCTFTTWLVVVARRLCIDRRRRLYGRSTREHSGVAERESRRRLMKLVAEELDLEAIADPEGATPLSSLEECERQEAIASALAKLDEKDRVLLALRFEDGLSVERIAVLMRMPSSFHVYRQLNRIFEVLRARLRAHQQSSTSSSAVEASRQKRRNKPFNQG